MSILNDLYYGRIRYDEKPITPKSEYDRLSRAAVDMENAIRAELSGESKKLFDEYTGQYDRMSDIVAFP